MRGGVLEAQGTGETPSALLGLNSSPETSDPSIVKSRKNSLDICRQHIYTSSLGDVMLLRKSPMAPARLQASRRKARKSTGPSGFDSRPGRAPLVCATGGDILPIGKPGGPAVSQTVPSAGFLKKGFLFLYDRSQ